MLSSQDQLRLLYQSSLDIGGSLDLGAMLERSLQSIVLNLGCVGAVVLADRRDGDHPFLEEILAEPAGIRDHAAYPPAVVDWGPSDKPGAGRTQWPDPLRRTIGDVTCYGLDLAGYGLLVLLNSIPLDPQLAQALKPICDKLAECCLACERGSSTGDAEAERALHASEEKFREYIDSSPDGVFLADSQGRYIDVNPAASTLTGYTREELLSMSIPDLLPSESLETARAHFSAVQAEGRATVEGKFLHKDGSPRWWIVDAVKLDDTRLLGFCKDTTDRMRAEAALQESEERFRAIFETAQDSIFIKNLNLEYMLINPAMERLFGTNAEELVGRTDGELFGEEAAKHIEEVDRRVLGGEVVMEEDTKPVDDVPRTFHVVKVPMRDDAGNIVGLCGIARDITERRVAEEERARLEEQVHQAQKMDSIGLLAGGVAHDLNNLLSPILGYGEILLEDAGDDSDQRESLEEIVKAGRRARDLVRQLLAFSRKQTLEFKHIDLNLLLTRFEKLLRHTIREDVTIDLALDELPLYIRGDIGHLEQVVMNLAINAQDAMPSGGKLDIASSRMELEQPLDGEHGPGDPGAYALLTIRDTGCGIDAASREHLFEPFYTTKSKDQGTGLGLATVYGIVKQHGGHITVDSEPEHGTVFRIYLPMMDDPPTRPERTGKPSAELAGTETIVLVEDNEQVRDLTLTILKRKGYTVLCAAGATQALTLLERHKGALDMLLTDVIMPEMDGRQLYERVSGLYPEIKVLYMSGYTNDVIANRGIGDTGVQFIQKPFSPVALTQKVREVLDL